MLLFLLATLAGFALLIWGADRLVLGAGALARNLGIAPLLIGLTVVGFATSLPEVLVSATAALAGATDLAIGNALGSNIANVGLVLAVAALTRPLRAHSETLQRELPVMLAISVVPLLLFIDGRLSRLDGLLLAGALLGFTWWVTRLGMRTAGHDPIEAEYAAELPTGIANRRALLLILLGLLAVLAGSKSLVWGAANLARALSVSETIIGVTMIAVGTSLPELAVSIVSARKGEAGLALGNVIGSNAFNALAVIGVAALVHPAPLDPRVVVFHLPVMLLFSLGFFFIAYNRDETLRVGRWAGAGLLAGYLVYLGAVVAELG